MNKGKFRNLEGEYYEEYFNLLSSLIRICKNEFCDFSQVSQLGEGVKEEEKYFNEENKKFDANKILIYCINQIKINH